MIAIRLHIFVSWVLGGTLAWRFLDSKKAAASDPSRSKNLALHKHYLSLPHRDTGSYLKLTHGTGRVIVPRKKKDLQPGNYVVRVRVGVVKGTPASRRFIEVGHPQRDIDSRDWGLKGKPIGVRQVTGTIEAPQIIEFPIDLRSGMPQEFAVQEKQPNTGNLKVLWDDHNRLVKEIERRVPVDGGTGREMSPGPRS